ncbi:cell wall hydrolase [Sphingomonas sp. NPDC019816]|uniref:cell wall hydrolase n=1 Tax=Sphingomonas sp. NPDC019816 TaxID=3390679 RepID=UPI003D04A346
MTRALIAYWEDRRGDMALLLGAGLCALIGCAVWFGWSPWQGGGYHRAGGGSAVIAAQVVRQVESLPTVTGVPLVTPVANLDVSADVARRVNALTPFASGPNPAARPFLWAGTPADRAAAETCLAAAAYYEAGSDPLGQVAVVQVVLNRVRHPAFPKTVCGVVTQGAERRTGCQFSFMCDGSLHRRVPSPAALTMAQAIARWALNGGVFRAVGGATHYHADYVVPRWSGAMDKVLAFHTHLFFRWRGPAGASAMLRGALQPGELARGLTAIAAMIGKGDTPVLPVATDPAATTMVAPDAAPAPVVASGAVVRADEWRGIFYLYFDPADYPGRFAVKAIEICGKRQSCLVYGWDKAERVPVAVTEARPAGVLFAYSRRAAEQKAMWDCGRIKRDRADQCLPGTSPRIEVPATVL